ncbi:hypothetical protein KKB18_04630, partial [bacterium]|nr:hypothetical protein [bacterium]
MQKTIILISTILLVLQGFCLYGGEEFRVNTYTYSDQWFPRTAIDGKGNFVISWLSMGQDGDLSGIFAQRYNYKGVPIGNEFRVNTVTKDNQYIHSIGMDYDGNFVVTWDSNNQNPDNEHYGIFSKRFDNQGNPLTNDVLVNTITSSEQHQPSIAMNKSGNYVIVWNNQANGKSGLSAQIFDKNGNPTGNEISVSNNVTKSHNPSVAIDNSRNFVVTWTGSDNNSNGIFAKRFDKDGYLIGNEIHVNNNENDSQILSSIAMNGVGNFIIAWQSKDQDMSDYGIYARRYNNVGNPIGSEFRVNIFTNGAQERPSVDIDENGNFIIAWQSMYNDGSNCGIFAQKYDENGNPIGEQFQVNTYTEEAQYLPCIAIKDLNNFIITW